MADFGNLTLYALLVLCTWSGAMALVGARRRSLPMIHAARRSLYATAVLSSVAVVVLAFAFAASDFALDYVHRYSDRTMPMFYKLTAVWGGQEGSLLLWTWLLAVMSAWAVHVNHERLRELIPYVILVLTVVIDFFCLLLLLSANPFDAFLVEIPAAGRGLNPLLQNPYMVTHPPALYVGYVGMAIPFAFALAALLAGETDEGWIRAARPWALASWYFLTMGLVLGMLWAYEELGWGGYWGWDPVENAGLFPWLTATAYIHSVMVQERRGMFKVWNLVLAILTFELTIFGTFLTRSGFIQSVHAFAQSDIGWYFLVFMFGVALFSAALIVWRGRLLRSRGALESVFSREFVVVVNNWVLLFVALLVMVLTIFPNISGHFGNKITIGAPAFNLWVTPPGLLLLLLTGVGPLFGWRKTTAAGARRQLLWPAVTAAVVIGLLFLLGVRPTETTSLRVSPAVRVIWSYLPILTFGLCAFVAAQVVQELVRGAAIRSRSTGVEPVGALLGLIGRNRRRYGGYIVHLGVAMMFLGFAGEGYKQETEVVMRRGQRVTVGSYTLRHDGITDRSDAQKRMLTATLSVFDRDGKKRLGTVRPARWVYFKHEGQPTTEVDIRRSAREDLFVALGDFDFKQRTATFKVVINPLVNWIWLGFVLLTVGVIIALVPTRVGARRVAARAAVVILALGLASLAAPHHVLARGPPENTAPKIDSSAAQQRLFKKLACMCPNCPRIPLADCQCGFAGRERSAIRKKLAQGWSEDRVLAWYLERRGAELGREAFGSAALTTPPDTGFNRLSWLLPYALGLVAVVLLVLAGRRWARRAPPDEAAPAPRSQESQPPKNEPDVYDELLERELRKLD
jgi:cytochrome c-type biogenesis protein CcmF